MAERQIPGGEFLNETATAQRQIPGGDFVNETTGAAAPTLPAASGTFVLTGNDVTFIAPNSWPPLVAGVGPFVWTGFDANLIHGYTIGGSSGSFVLTGAPSLSDHQLTAEIGSFVLTGNDAGLLYGLGIAAARGSFLLSGTSTNFFLSGAPLSIQSEVGAFLLTGNAVLLQASKGIGANGGVFALTFQDARLFHGKLQADTGSFSLTGADVNFTVTRVNTVSLDFFLPWVMPDVRDCPPLIARDAIREAAIEFCERTLVLQNDLFPLDVVSGTATYDLVAAENYLEVAEPVEVRYDGDLIDPLVRSDMTANTDWTQEQGEVIGYTMDQIGVIRLIRIPDESIAAGLKVLAAMKPNVTAKVLDKRLLHRHYRRAIVDGAKAILLSMKDKAWTSQARAEEFRDDFYEAIGAVTVEVSQGFVRGAKLRTKSYYSIG